MLTGASSNGGGAGGGASAIDYLLAERLLELERLDKVQRMELLIQLSEDDLRATLDALEDKDWFSAESAETMAYIEEHKGSYEGPVWQVQPEVLDDGDTAETLSLIESSHRKWKYTSGVISFDFDDKPTAEEMAEIRREFEDFMFAGKDRETFNILWVQHGDKGRAENHFLIPRLDLETGQDLNICQRGYIEDFRVWNTYICEKYGFRDPLKVQQPQFKFVRENKDREQIRATITKAVEDKIAAGTVRSREDVIAVLEGFGTKTREGKDSFSIKIEGFEKNFKFEGGPLLEGAITGNPERFVRRPINDEALEAATDAMRQKRDERAGRFAEIRQKSNYLKNNSPGQFGTIAPPNIAVDPATEAQEKALEAQRAQEKALEAQRAQEKALEAQRAQEKALEAAGKEAGYKVQFETLGTALKAVVSEDSVTNVQNKYLRAMKQPDPTPKWERAYWTLRDVIRSVFRVETFTKILDRYSELMAPPVAPPPPASQPEPTPAPVEPESEKPRPRTSSYGMSR